MSAAPPPGQPAATEAPSMILKERPHRAPATSTPPMTARCKPLSQNIWTAKASDVWRRLLSQLKSPPCVLRRSWSARQTVAPATVNHPYRRLSITLSSTPNARAQLRHQQPMTRNTTPTRQSCLSTPSKRTPGTQQLSSPRPPANKCPTSQ